MTGFSQMQNRIAALLLLAAALLLIWYGAGVPYLDALSVSRQQIAAAAAHLQLYRKADTRISGIAPQQGATSAALLLPGASAASAGAYLQQQAGLLAQNAGALLLSFELLPPFPEDAAPLQSVAGRMRVSANTTSLRALLYALETHRPLLQIDNLFVRARNDQDTVPGGHLDVQLDVTGYRPLTGQAAP